MDANEAFEFACRAYLHALAAYPVMMYNLKLLDPNQPKTLYVIARLMHSYATNDFDRNIGKHLGGKSRSRSKKRGRKSVHRRKKSMHKKRK